MGRWFWTCGAEQRLVPLMASVKSKWRRQATKAEHWNTVSEQAGCTQQVRRFGFRHIGRCLQDWLRGARWIVHRCREVALFWNLRRRLRGIRWVEKGKKAR